MLIIHQTKFINISHSVRDLFRKTKTFQKGADEILLVHASRCSSLVPAGAKTGGSFPLEEVNPKLALQEHYKESLF